MSGIERRALIVGVVGAGMAAVFKSTPALAADPKLDSADAAIEKAIALLRAAQGPAVPQFGTHINKAINDLQRARDEIGRAKRLADNPPPKPKDQDKDDKGRHKGKP